MKNFLYFIFGIFCLSGVHTTTYATLLTDALSGDLTEESSIVEINHIIRDPKTAETINDVETGGSTALMIASERGCPEFVDLLLDVPGIDTEYADSHSGWTAFLLAAFNGHTAVLERLLPRIRYINHVDLKGRTALLWATHRGHAKSVSWLLQQMGIQINQPNFSGGTALMLAERSGREDIRQILLARGAVTLPVPTSSSVKVGILPGATEAATLDELALSVEDNCTICHSPFEAGQVASRGKCPHFFHQFCLRRLFAENGESGAVACPNCRASLPAPTIQSRIIR